jgi:pilus assembly protein Flp/PilA
MLKFYIQTTEALKNLRNNKDGVVSFEYVIVAACIVGAVSLAFGIGASGAIKTALSDAITAIVAKVTAATS